MARCQVCGTKVGILSDICGECLQDRKAAELLDEPSLAESQERDARIQQKTKFRDVKLTTAPHIEGYRIEESIDIVSAECVFGMNILKDFFTGMSDFFGGRSETSQKVLRDAREACLNELRREADHLGGNAVIAVDLDYSEMSGGGRSMLFIVASGTAVKISKELSGESHAKEG